MRLMLLSLSAAFVLALGPRTATAQRLVDPDKVAPEFRVAAEKRRAEQLKIIECSHKADDAKLMPRDRAAHIQHCLDER